MESFISSGDLMYSIFYLTQVTSSTSMNTVCGGFGACLKYSSSSSELFVFSIVERMLEMRYLTETSLGVKDCETFASSRALSVRRIWRGARLKCTFDRLGESTQVKSCSCSSEVCFGFILGFWKEVHVEGLRCKIFGSVKSGIQCRQKSRGCKYLEPTGSS